MPRRSLRRVALWSLTMLVALAVGTATAWSDTAADKHAAQDNVVLDQATEAQQTQNTVERSAVNSAAVSAAISTDPGSVGQWGPLEDWPVVGINVALMPNGKVVASDALGDLSYTKYTDQSYTRATVWNPVTDIHTSAWEQLGYNIFCAGFAALVDGTLFYAGGNADPNSTGLVNTTYFDYRTSTWTRGPDMQFPRWYPTVTALTNGEMLITSGRPWIPEVRQTDGTLRTLSEQTATQDLPLYPWMDVGPNGRVFYSGPSDELRSIDAAGGGNWQQYGARGDGVNRDYGSHAMYDVGKILVAGGGPSVKSAVTIDINGSTPRVTPTSPMAFGRRQFTLTDLPDGTVLATGGNSDGATYVDVNAGVYNPEIWNPATGNWTTVAPEQVTRQYHSSALLLPDGRVLSSGGGICNDCDDQGYLGKNAQIFSPPYLFKKDGSGAPAPRPSITDAPSEIGYGTTFPINTPDAASIRKVALIKLGAVTHDVNMEQRYVPLSFTQGAGQLNTTMPSNQNLAPPGYYMLFVVNNDGVPSVAPIVHISGSAPPPPPPGNQPPSVTLTQPANGATYTAPATVDLAATASDDGSVSKVEFFNGTTKLGEDTTAPYTYSWTGVGVGTYTLTARATDNLGATTTSTASTITVNSGTNQPPTATITSPADNAVFPWKPTITISATASDADGTVASVAFYDGTALLGRDTTAPYSFTWKNVAQGTHTLTARATDNAGAAGTSAPVRITVQSRR